MCDINGWGAVPNNSLLLRCNRSKLQQNSEQFLVHCQIRQRPSIILKMANQTVIIVLKRFWFVSSYAHVISTLHHCRCKRKKALGNSRTELRWHCIHCLPRVQNAMLAIWLLLCMSHFFLLINPTYALSITSTTSMSERFQEPVHV
jgi:hypothetical protein